MAQNMFGLSYLQEFESQCFTVLFSVDRDRSRTMPSRIETRSVAGSYASGPRSISTGNGNRYFHERPRSVNSNFESGRHPHGLGSISVDQSGYVSDKTDLGYQHQYARRASGSSGMVNRIDRLRVNPQQPPPVRYVIKVSQNCMCLFAKFTENFFNVLFLFYIFSFLMSDLNFVDQDRPICSGTSIESTKPICCRNIFKGIIY